MAQAQKKDQEFALAVSQILQQRSTSSPEDIQSLIADVEQRFDRKVPVTPFVGKDSSGSGTIRTITNSDGSQTIIRYKDGQWTPEYTGQPSGAEVERQRKAENESQSAATQQ